MAVLLQRPILITPNAVFRRAQDHTASGHLVCTAVQAALLIGVTRRAAFADSEARVAVLQAGMPAKASTPSDRHMLYSETVAVQVVGRSEQVDMTPPAMQSA